ncbi:AI-2E family transporter [Pigmentiphaga litoralis]|jgi:predicted PurR-regulated permease PerM|uniref:AI-2E family transporter n=1 Tax=Pigmentiphaga litoralis TaxID=516702 RepID=UPI0016732918|nr:AI-2E family transporter [Pigmentiphaga litoralis]GGX06141.1 AI-2E family transporter [Pigmentiphaga litoralis]
MNNSSLHYKTFLLILIVVSIAFVWILQPFIGAVFWGTILAIIFAPLNRKLVNKFGKRRNAATLVTLLLVLLIVILPLMLITGSLVQQGSLVYDQIKSGNLNFGAYFQRAFDALPLWVHDIMVRFGLSDIASIQTKLADAAAQGSQLMASKAVSIGQDTFQLLVSFAIMLYLMFFLLRDGPQTARRIRQAIPLSDGHKQHLLQKFTTIARATVKGNIAVALVQGALGGIIFWILGVQAPLLWAVVMAFLSLLPAVGAGLVWGPVAIYFLLTGSIWEGVVLIAFGFLVIGLVDNILRPLLVGKDTRMPDYVVLISTLGGMALFGLSGFVIGPVIAGLFMAAWDLFATEDMPETVETRILSGPGDSVTVKAEATPTAPTASTASVAPASETRVNTRTAETRQR